MPSVPSVDGNQSIQRSKDCITTATKPVDGSSNFPPVSFKDRREKEGREELLHPGQINDCNEDNHFQTTEGRK